MTDNTLRLPQGSNGTLSLTMQLRFVDRAGRYILQQRVKIKRQASVIADRWQDVELFKEPGK